MLEREVMKAVSSVRTGDFHRNWSSTENSALKNLKTYDDIIINPTTYRRLDYDPTPEFNAEIKSLIFDLGCQGILSADMCEFALWSHSKRTCFYLLPKVHNPGASGRLVISSCGSITQKNLF